MTRCEKLWCELSVEEKAEEKREFLESYAAECGGDPGEYCLRCGKNTSTRKATLAATRLS